MNRIKNYNIVLSCILFFVFTSCGLDTIMYLEPPHFTRHADSEQDSEQYIEFKTSDADNAVAYCTGFQIFYKIYALKSEMTTDVAAINSYNSSTPYSAARYLIETKKYQTLKASTQPIVLHTGITDRTVKVRLYDYSTPPDPNAETAGLYVGGTRVNVYRADETNFAKLPNSTEAADIFKTSSTDEYQFVAFFAVTVGLDEHFTALYSQVVDLGYLILK